MPLAERKKEQGSYSSFIFLSFFIILPFLLLFFFLSLKQNKQIELCACECRTVARMCTFGVAYSFCFLPPSPAKLSTAIAKKTFSKMSGWQSQGPETRLQIQEQPYGKVNQYENMELIDHQMYSIHISHWKDTVTTDEKNDKVNRDNHIGKHWSTIRHDAIIHDRVPVLSC